MDQNHLPLASGKDVPSLPAPKWAFITPAQAGEMLSPEGSNRPVKGSVVKEYRRLMNAGLWRLSPHGITLDQHGYAADGNHRLHALSGADVEGLWFLVCDWRLRASELRVDRGTARSVGDFIGMTPMQSAPLCTIAAVAGAGSGQRRDPEEMRPVIAVYADLCNSLIEVCPTVRRHRSAATIRAAIAIAMQGCDQETQDALRLQYRYFVLGSSESWPSFFSLARQIDIRNMDTWEQLTRTYNAATNRNANRITTSENDMATIRARVRKAIQQPQPSSLPAASSSLPSGHQAVA